MSDGARIVVVQVIDVQYGKGTRGGEGARRRAALPRALPVPTVEDDTLHLVTMHEWHDFAPHVRVERLLLPSAAPQIAHRVRVARDGDGAVIVGDEHVPRALVITGGWGRLRVNQLERSFETTWYRDVIVNVACATSPASGTVFAGAPAVERDLRRPIERRRQPWARR